jgi:hypothetical protein
MGPTLDVVVISHDVECVSYEESGDAYAPFYCASSVITPWGYKAGDHSCATYIIPHDLPPSSHFLPYG